jgi:uncharacterized protein
MISGTTSVDAPRLAFWDALQDPAVLARTLPGCESLEVLGEDHYAATVTAGVASVKGTYSGEVRLHEQQPPEQVRLEVAGAGTPGTIRADVQLRLEEGGAGCVVSYEADAVVGGMLGGVGQRMIGAAARRTADEFFAAVATEVREGPPVAAATPATPTAAPAGAPAAAGGPAVGQVFAGRAEPSAAAASRPTELFGAFALGAAVALVGVLVGRLTARGRRRA